MHTPGTVPTSRRDLLAEIAGHVDRCWKQSATAARIEVSEGLRPRLIAIATLAGADDESEGAELLRLLPELDDAPAERRYALSRWISGMYPGPGWWKPLEPDTLGEYLVGEHLTSLPQVLGGVLRRNPHALVQPLSVYGRIVRDSPELSTGLSRVLDELLVDPCWAAIEQTLDQPDVRLLLGPTAVADC